MRHFEHTESGIPKAPFHHRIMANLRVQVSWIDKVTGNTVLVEGLTENVGENSALVNLEPLPPVGSEVSLRVIDEEKTLIEVPTEVIRVERDPSKPLAALSIAQNLINWKQNVMTAAQVGQFVNGVSIMKKNGFNPYLY